MMNTKYWIVKGLNIISFALKQASRTIKYNANFPRGVWVVRAEFGHTVMIDEFCLPYELSWSEAEELRKYLEALKNKRRLE